MIGWHDVEFHHVREGKTHYHVRCCPINNKDTRLVMRGPSSEWKEGEGPFTAGVWDAGERECFQQLRAKLAELEGQAEQRVKELEEEIEYMRVTDPTELAAQLLNMKALVDAAKDLSEPILHLLWEEGDGTVQCFLKELKAWKEHEEVRKNIDILPEGKAERQYEPRVVRSEPGGYAEPEGKLRKS